MPCPIRSKGLFLISSHFKRSRFFNIFICACEKPISLASRPCLKYSASCVNWSHIANALEDDRPLTSEDASSGVSVRTLRTSWPYFSASASAVVFPRPLMLSARKEAMRRVSPALSSTRIFFNETWGLLFHSVTLPEIMYVPPSTISTLDLPATVNLPLQRKDTKLLAFLGQNTLMQVTFASSISLPISDTDNENSLLSLGSFFMIFSFCFLAFQDANKHKRTKQ